MDIPTTFDKSQIDEIVRLFFGVFTNSNNKQPDFVLLTKICVPEVSLINVIAPTYVAFTLESFIEPRKKILTDGTLTDFEEIEVSEQTHQVGNIAQRHSIYTKSGVRDNKPFKQRGHKFLQLIKTEEGWRINAVVWQDEV